MFPNVDRRSYGCGRLKDSERVLLETLPIARDSAMRVPIGKVGLFQILNNIVLVYSDEHRFEEAEVTANEALKLASDFPSPLRESSSSAIEINLGYIYLAAKQFDQAERSFAVALETRRQLALHAPGAFRPDVAMILFDLSVVYENTNRVNDASKALTEAVDIYRQESVHNPSVGANFIQALMKMAELESQSGQFEDAGKALQEAKDTIATVPNLDLNSRAALSQLLDEQIRKSQKPPTHEP
jgi:tetratricopeptide (TPR) repeat protein